MFIGWLTCIPAALLPHSLCRSTTVKAPANRQMPIASVVMGHSKRKGLLLELCFKIFDELSALRLKNDLQLDFFVRLFDFRLADNSSQIFKEERTGKENDFSFDSTITIEHCDRTELNSVSLLNIMLTSFYDKNLIC